MILVAVATGGLVAIMMLMASYLVGVVCVTAAAGLFAFVFRKSHGMRPSQAAFVTLAAGAAWPLLAVALVQAVGLLGIARLQRLGRPKGNVEPESAVATAGMTAEPVSIPLTAGLATAV